MMEPLQKSSDGVDVNKDGSTYDVKNSNHLRQLCGRQRLRVPDINDIQLVWEWA